MTATKILALDCSTPRCSVALAGGIHSGDDGAQIAQISKIRKRSHHRLVLPMIERLLGEHKLSLADLDLLVCGLGPGSFVGVRIAVGVAQALASARDIKLAGFSSLEALAFAAWNRESSASVGSEAKQAAQYAVLSCIDLKPGEVYWAFYEAGDDGLKEVRSPSVAPVEDIKSPKSELPLIVVGGDEQNLQGVLRNNPAVASVANLYPAAADLVSLAIQKRTKGDTDPAKILPIYSHAGLRG